MIFGIMSGLHVQKAISPLSAKILIVPLDSAAQFPVKIEIYIKIKIRRANNFKQWKVRGFWVRFQSILACDPPELWWNL